jgi:hypothetical protein
MLRMKRLWLSLALAVTLTAVAAVSAGLTAASAGTSALAGPPSQLMAAFALVDPNGACPSSSPTCGSPGLVAAHTRGFIDVTVGPFGAGDYCLTPTPGVDVVNTAAVAAEEIFYSNVFGVAGVRYPTAGPHCGANRLEVKTFDSTPALTNQIGFTVIVP